jgi:hypothetical protein
MAVWNIVRYGSPGLLRKAASHQDPGVRRLFWTALCDFRVVFDRVSDVSHPYDLAAQDVKTLLQGPACSISKECQVVFAELAARTLEQDPSEPVRQAAAKASSIFP